MTLDPRTRHRRRLLALGLFVGGGLLAGTCIVLLAVHIGSGASGSWGWIAAGIGLGAAIKITGLCVWPWMRYRSG